MILSFFALCTGYCPFCILLFCERFLILKGLYFPLHLYIRRRNKEWQKNDLPFFMFFVSLL